MPARPGNALALASAASSVNSSPASAHATRQPFCAPFSRRIRVSLRVSMSAIADRAARAQVLRRASPSARQFECRRGRSRTIEPGGVDARRFHVLGVDAGVADVRIRERDDLPAVGRVGEDLLVPGDRGVEHHLAHGAAPRAPMERPRKTVPSARTRTAASAVDIVFRVRMRKAGSSRHKSFCAALPASLKTRIIDPKRRPCRRGPAAGPAGTWPRAGRPRRRSRGSASARVTSMRSPVPANITVCSPTMSPPRMRVKADLLRVALAGVALPAVARARRQARGPRPSPRPRPACSAVPRRRIDLVAVVRLDDLDVVAVAEARAAVSASL